MSASSVVLSISIAEVSLKRKYVQRKIRRAQSIPIKGSSQFQPKYFAQISARIAKTEVRASAITWIYAD